MTEVSPLPDAHVRVGDDERRAVDERLHRAVGEGRLTLLEYEERAGAVWQARTRGELAAVVRDLPGTQAAPSAPVPTGRVRRAVAVMSEERLQGPVAPGEEVSGVAVMGAARLDLAGGDLPPAVRVRAVAVMGEVQVLVPPGTGVQLSGASVMGDRRVDLPAPVPGGPVVHLHAVAVMGSVSVRTGAPGNAVAAVSAAPPVRRRRHLGRCLAGLGIAAVVVSGAVGGHDGGHGDDQRVRATADGSVSIPRLSEDATVTVAPGVTQVRLPPASGDITVVLPRGASAVVDDQGSGEVDCDGDVCQAPGTSVVTVTATGSGDVDVRTAD